MFNSILSQMFQTPYRYTDIWVFTFFVFTVICLATTVFVMRRKLARKSFQLEQALSNRDETEIKSSEINNTDHYISELDKSMGRFKTLFNLLPFSCTINDLKGRYLFVNNYYCNALKKPLDEIIGSTMEEIGRFVYNDNDKKLIMDKLLKNGLIEGEEVTVYNDGEKRHIIYSSCLIDWEGEKCVLSSTVDITARKKAEVELKESQERFQMAFDAANDGIWDLNLKTGKMYCSANYYKMLGYNKGDFPDFLDSWKELLHPDDRDTANKRFGDYLKGKLKEYESEFRLKNKKTGWTWVLSRGRVVESDSDGSPVRVIGTHIDMTEKKISENALLESEENLLVTLNSIGDAVIATDTEGKITRINPVAQKLTGWILEEAIGEDLQKVFNVSYDDTGKVVERPVQKVLLSGNPTVHASQLRLKSRDGELYLIAGSGSSIENKSGDSIGAVFVFRDVTEKRKMEEKLRHNQKMEAIGVLAGGISHDFNNILSGIMGFTDLAIMEAGEQQPLKQYLNIVSEGSLRARDLVSHILTFSRKASARKELISINPVIKETVKFIRASLPANIEIKSKYTVKDVHVIGDSTQLHQILMNLFTNAGYAMRECGGCLEVVLDTVNIENFDNLNEDYIKPGKYVYLTVSDNGCGIPKNIRDRIFEPFFTTKKRGEGTGMGLSTVYGILKEMGGGISVYSEADIGTTFKIFIPLKEKAQYRAEDIRTKLIKGHGRILLVDDEVKILDATDKILSGLGYSVEVSQNGEEALDKIQKKPDEFDLVLTDLTMSKMNGLELAEKIKVINPDISIILCTGFSDGITKEMYISKGVNKMINKPLIASELSRIVHDAITESSQKDYL